MSAYAIEHCETKSAVPYIYGSLSVLSLINIHEMGAPCWKLTPEEIQICFHNAICCDCILCMFQEADLVLLVGTNPRFEAPLVNTRIRKRLVEINVFGVTCITYC